MFDKGSDLRAIVKALEVTPKEVFELREAYNSPSFDKEAYKRRQLEILDEITKSNTAIESEASRQQKADLEAEKLAAVAKKRVQLRLEPEPEPEPEPTPELEIEPKIETDKITIQNLDDVKPETILDFLNGYDK